MGVNAVPTRRLGAAGPAASALGLGCMGMSEFYGARDESESIAAIHRALDLGITLLDTADMYGRGANEELVGRALRGRRDRALVATKLGIQRGGGPGGRTIRNGRPDYVRAACEASLRRLGVETIDLLTLHRLDPEVPIEETIGAMAELVHQGKVCFLGLSEVGAPTLRRAHAVHPIAALQSEYSLWSREPEAEMLPLCRELSVGFIAYSPLGRGLLTGTIRSAADLTPDDDRRQWPRFRPENLVRNAGPLERIEAIARAKCCTPAQLALAWVLGRGNDVVALFGTTKRARVEENVAAVDVLLAPEDLAAIELAAPPGVAAGARYPEAVLARLSGESSPSLASVSRRRGPADSTEGASTP